MLFFEAVPAAQIVKVDPDSVYFPSRALRIISGLGIQGFLQGSFKETLGVPLGVYNVRDV